MQACVTTRLLPDWPPVVPRRRFVSKVKGSKAMDDGETVKKAEFAEYAEQRTKSTVESHTSELDQLRLSQACARMGPDSLHRRVFHYSWLAGQMPLKHVGVAGAWGRLHAPMAVGRMRVHVSAT
jgi:hypothetical protein